MRYLDPTISNYTKAISQGIASERAYKRQVRFDLQHGERAERLACIAMIRANLPEEEWPAWAREDEAVAGAGAGAGAVAPRKATRKRLKGAEGRYRRELRVQEVKCDLGRLVEAWGARVRDSATLEALRNGR